MMVSLQELSHHPLVDMLGWALLHSLWQGALLMLLLRVTLFALRRRSAQSRYLVAYIALTAMAVCPLLTVVATHVAEAPAVFLHLSAPHSVPAAPPAVHESVLLTGRQETLPAKLEPLFPIMVAVWLFGVCGMSVRLGIGCVRVRKLAKATSSPRLDALKSISLSLRQRMGLDYVPLLLESSRVEVPTLIGWLRAVILLPPSALAGLSPQALEALLAHEFAHIRRNDYLFTLLQAVLETLLFYHPATWWISARIRIEREHCCDDLAIQTLGDRAVYVRALASMESLRVSPPTLALAANGGSLLIRVRRLLGLPHTNPHPLPPLGAIVLAFSALVGPLLFVQNLSLPAAPSIIKQETQETENREQKSLFGIASNPVNRGNKTSPPSRKSAFVASAPALRKKTLSVSFVQKAPDVVVREVEAVPPPEPAPAPPPMPRSADRRPESPEPFAPQDSEEDRGTRRVLLAMSQDEDNNEKKMLLASDADGRPNIQPAVSLQPIVPNIPTVVVTHRGEDDFEVKVQDHVVWNANFTKNFQLQAKFGFEQGMRDLEKSLKQAKFPIEDVKRLTDQARRDAEQGWRDAEEQKRAKLRELEKELRQRQKDAEREKRQRQWEDEQQKRQQQQEAEARRRDEEREQRQRQQEKQEKKDRKKAQEKPPCQDEDGDDGWKWGKKEGKKPLLKDYPFAARMALRK